jgi:hypothetical protein
MTREPLEYPGDPYNDPDYDEVAILKAEIARLTRLLDAFHDGGAAAEIERLQAENARLRSYLISISRCVHLARAALEPKP